MHRYSRMVAALLCAAIVLPATAAAEPKHVEPNGSVRAEWNLAKPKVKRHPDTAPDPAGGTGDGTNNIAFGSFDDGDMIVVLGVAFGHAGEWDSAYWHGSVYDRSFISANMTPVNGVQREQPIKYRQYDRAYGLWVPAVPPSGRVRARDYARTQMGEPYLITSSKSDQSRWYCSKLLWSSYRYTSGLDLDADGGYWVWPVDLVNHPKTYVFAYGN